MALSRRPILVWMIFLGYTAVSIAGIGLLFLLTSGLYDLPPEQRALLAGMGVFDRVAGYLLAGMTIVGVFLLFRLKRVAVSVLFITLALDAATKVITFYRFDLADYVAVEGLVGQLAGSVLFALVYLYARWLAKKGVLA